VYPPGIANLYPHDRSLEPVRGAATLLVVEPPPAHTLSEAVDAWLQDQSVYSLTQRVDSILGGEPAVIVEGRGRRCGVRAILALHEGRLYALTFYPVDERHPQAAPDVEALWQTVIDTFAFLSPETRAALEEIAESETGPTPVSPSLPADTPAPSQHSFESTTYRDELAGFEFDHPRSWTLGYQENQTRGYSVQLCAQSPDQARIQVAVMLWEPNDLDGFSSRQEQSWLASGSTIHSREEWMLTGDHRAIRYLVQARLAAVTSTCWPRSPERCGYLTLHRNPVARPTGEQRQSHAYPKDNRCAGCPSWVPPCRLRAR
jgi:hypothetical protein